MMSTALRILILEDSLSDTELMIYELRSCGIELEWQRVETEADYLACLNAGWDIIISDYGLPQFGALRALRLLQAHELDIPFIVVTGSVSEEVAVECMKQGAADYLLKDRLVRLGEAVKQAVQQKVLHDQKRQTEAALQESEERFRRLADNAQDIIYRYQLSPPRFEYISPAVTKITGYTPEEYYANPDLASQIVHQADRRLWQRSLAGDQALMLRWICKDRSTIWIEQTNVRIYDNAGNMIAVEGIIRDVTARRQAEIQLEQQAERDRLLSAISTRIRQSLDIEEILHTTVAEVRHFLQADRVLIIRFEANDRGVLVAESVATNYPIDPGIEFGKNWFQEQAASQRGLVQTIDDVAQANIEPKFAALLQQLQVKARLTVPILQGDYAWGLLVVHQCTQPRQWQPIEVDLLEKLAIQVAIAIQQGQLFNQVQQQATREQLLNHISQSLNSSLDPQHILQEIVNLTGEGFGVDRVLIFSIEAEQIRISHEWRRHTQILSLHEQKIGLINDTDLLDPTSNTSLYRVFHTNNYAEIPLSPMLRSIVNQSQIFSELRVPIFIRDQFFGGLSLQTTTTHRTFTAEEILLLQRIANQAAIALYNAQSYERLEQLVCERTQELEQEKLISEAADRAKTDFLANMSHELRTPLTGILGFSNLLSKQIFGQLNEKQQQYVSLIYSSGQHLLDLISDLLDLSKIEAGKEELYLDTIKVEELCEECLSLIHERAQKRDIQLSLIIKPDTINCIADKRRLKQILFNLLSNAVKFTQEGKVTLQVEKIASTIEFSVIDTGIGIAQKDLENLFQPFQQIDSGLNRKYEGTGLGLVLSRRLARLHGGDLTVTSYPGHGSCFVLSLPVQPLIPNPS